MASAIRLATETVGSTTVRTADILGTVSDGLDAGGPDFMHQVDSLPWSSLLTIYLSSLEQLYWKQRHRQMLLWDGAFWCYNALLTAIMLSALSPSTAVTYCAPYLAVLMMHGWCMFCFPNAYMQHRHLVWFVEMPLRIFQLSGLPAKLDQGMYTSISNTISDNIAWLRCALITSGVFSNIMSVVGFQPPIKQALLLQAISAAVLLKGSTTTVVAFLTAQPNLHSLLSGICAASENVTLFARHVGFFAADANQCSRHALLSMVITFQLYFGYVVPLVLLYVHEATCKEIPGSIKSTCQSHLVPGLPSSYTRKQSQGIAVPCHAWSGDTGAADLAGGRYSHQLLGC